MKPQRILRSRARGSRLVSPNGLPIVCVSRPSKWGNPFSVGLVEKLSNVERRALRAASVARFQQALLSADHELGFTVVDVQRELAGKNLACWCPLDQPCHAQVLIEVANHSVPGGARGRSGAGTRSSTSRRGA